MLTQKKNTKKKVSGASFGEDIIEQKMGEKEDIFSPISEFEAKQFALSQSISQDNFNAFSQNILQERYGDQFAFINPTIGASFINLKEVSIEDFAEFVRQKEAKLSDIPIPLNSVPIKRYFQELSAQNKIILGYKTRVPENNGNDRRDIIKDSLHSIVTFYNQEMERLGWKNVAFFDGFEKLMIFQKPSKFCTVSLRRCLQEDKECEDAKLEQAKIVICVQV